MPATLEREFAMYRDHFERLDPDRPMGQLGSRVPTSDELSDIDQRFAEAIEELSSLAHELSTMDFAVSEGLSPFRLTAEESLRLLLFAQDIERFYGEKISEALAEIRTASEFMYRELPATSARRSRKADPA